MQDEKLIKSLDSLIDNLFAQEEESIEKSMIKDAPPQEETADEAMKKVPGYEDDKKRNAGRSKEISDVPKIDEDGRRQDTYDDAIASKNEDGKTPEQDQVKPAPEMIKKSWEQTPEYAEYVALKKAKEESEKAEVLKKAKEEQVDLIKSAVREATSEIAKENEFLKAQLMEQGELIKSIANKPQKGKAITNLTAVEKFQKSEASSSYSKQDLLDAAESLVKSKQLDDVHLIELEQTGYIFDAEARRVLEKELKKR